MEKSPDSFTADQPLPHSDRDPLHHSVFLLPFQNIDPCIRCLSVMDHLCDLRDMVWPLMDS